MLGRALLQAPSASDSIGAGAAAKKTTGPTARRDPASAPPAAPPDGERHADDPEELCPICWVNGDDHGDFGMCFECVIKCHSITMVVL